MSFKQDVINRAAQSAPVNRNTAFAAVRDILNDPASHVLDPVALAELYRYFMPKSTTKKAGTDNWTWVAQACDPKDHRIALRYIHVTPAHYEATDGHRIHRAPNIEGLTPGLYVPSGDMAFSESDPGRPKWPDMERVMPARDRQCSVDIGRGDVVPAPSVAGGHAYVIDLPDDGTYPGRHNAYSKKYIDQALAGASTPADIKWLFSETHQDGAATLAYGSRLAVVMPCRL